MSHIQVIIHLPLKYNPAEGSVERKDVEPIKFLETYNELFEMANGVNTNPAPIKGSWLSPKDGRVDDDCLVYNVVFKCSDKDDIKKNEKIKQLIDYKKKLMLRFEQDSIYMLAIPCYWL